MIAIMAPRNLQLLSAGLALFPFSMSAAQPLNEIEAWVFEETQGRTGVAYGAIRPFFLPDRAIAGAVVLDPDDPHSYPQPYILDTKGFHPLRMPPSTDGFFDLLSDESGNLYAHTLDLDRFPAASPTVWVNGIPKSVPGINNALVSLDAVSPAGRGIGRVSMPASSTIPTALAIWFNTQLPPEIIPLPTFPLAGMSEDSQFIPRIFTDEGDAAGLTIDSRGSVISFAWLLNDGTTIEFPVETRRLESDWVYYIAFEPTGNGGAIVATRTDDATGLHPQHHIYSLTQKRLKPIWSSNAPNDFPRIATAPTGAYLIQVGTTMRLKVGETSLDISNRIATAMPVGALGDLAEDLTILTVLGVLRPTTCLADTNRDRMLNADDFSDWLKAFRAGSGIADQNLDQQLTPADFSAWIIRYNRGCDFGD